MSQQEAVQHLPQPASPASGWMLSSTLLGGMLLVIVVRAFGAVQWTDTFCAYFFAITLSAIPYILFGALFSGLTEVFLPPDLLVRITRRFGLWGIPAMALIAPVFPICECGVVAVVRSLLRKGLPLPYALTYLLAAPIVNPIVMASTYMAFQSLRYAVFRILGGLIVSTVIGLLFARWPQERALLPELLNNRASAGTGACGCGGHASRLNRLIAHIRGDFLDMMPYFLLGVFAASAMKTLLSDNALALASTNPIGGPAVMMITAFVLSLCSEADAFPAASFTTFSFPAHMAFLVLGPMLDIKLLLMYRSAFRVRFILVFAASIIAGVAAYVALLEMLP